MNSISKHLLWGGLIALIISFIIVLPIDVFMRNSLGVPVEFSFSYILKSVIPLILFGMLISYVYYAVKKIKRKKSKSIKD